MLYDKTIIEHEQCPPFISRIKVLAKLDIAQSRLPQDGKIPFVYQGRSIDIRVSTFPSIHGEKIVLRILDGVRGYISFDQLGMDPVTAERLFSCVRSTSGFFLVCGPTGSGKTTTLYALIEMLNTEHTHIITLEDPVEYTLNGITQSQVNPAIGFTFAAGIRALLRQDPDIALIGEIRDAQTASIAIEASLTGHLVLSTLHANNAVSVVVRLMDMGIEPFLINASLTGVLAQRLVRMICHECKELHTSTEQERTFLQSLGATTMSTYKGRGCRKCLNTGYLGRIGIFELLRITDSLRSLIIKKADAKALLHTALNEGMQTLASDACMKLAQGTTTISEIMRVLA
jgi:type II secretory ATPase GspE/PulE/Tfp pilus assembly ATPase PilB-like protein